MLHKEDSLNSNSDESEDEKMSSNKRKRESDHDESSSSEEEEESDEDEVDEDSSDNSENVSESDCETDSQEAESDSDESNISTSSKTKPSSSASEEVDSDNSTRKSDREVCAICLSYMKGDIGSPELCDHSFCLECILEWAKTNNSCPQDRTQFLQVFVRKSVKGKIIRTITVEQVKPDDIPEEEEDEEPTFCEVCGRCDREDTLLLCDGCDSGHHLECLSPPLNSVPIEEWYCNECQALDRMRMPHEDVIGLDEVTSLIDDAGTEPRLTQNRSCRSSTVMRRLPRTRASERIQRRIRRARTSRGENFRIASVSESEDETDELEEGAEVAVSTTSSQKAVQHANKKRKVTIKKKRKTKRKTKKRKRKMGVKKKTTTKTKKKTTKRRKRKTSRKKTGKKRKTTTKKRGAKWMKKKGKKKPNPQVIITPKARLAEALGIRPMKNPWQLSLPAMTGCRSQEGASLTNQRWMAGVPSLSLLGSNSELDYISEPDELGDAILVAGVARRHQNAEMAIARRKAMAVEVLSQSAFPSLRNISSFPISDSNVSSVSDLLGDIIQSQSKLHKNAQKLNSNEQNKDKLILSPIGQEVLGKQMGTGPDSPTREGNQTQSPPKDQSNRNGQPPRFIYGVYSTSKASDNFLSNVSFSSNGDPTGSKAYSTYLREHSQTDDAGIPESSSSKQDKKKSKKQDKKKGCEDDDVNLYSDIEPEIPEENDDSENEDEERENEVNRNLQEQHEENDSPLSGDELVIDDSIRQEVKDKNVLSKTISGGTNSENEVGSSNLPGLNHFELEAVSDADTHEMDKSMNSSISLSDSNMGDAEVTSSTNELNMCESEHKAQSNRIVHMYNRPAQNRFISSVNPTRGMGLEGLETETISDNEEICFEDNYGNEDDNIEEGEIPNDNLPRALPANRPKINIQLRRVIEVSSPNKEFEGECEEGEIIDESAAKKEKKREKAKREVDEIVNQQLDDDPKEIVDKENVNPDANTSIILPSDLEINSPDKLLSPTDKNAKIKDKKEKLMDKEKEKEKDKEKPKDKPRDKDIAFKKVSRNTKIRNYRDNDKDLRNRRRGSRERSYSRERIHSRERAYSRERGHSKERGGRMREKNREGGYGNERYRRRERDRKREPKRKEMERYNVRQMINKKEEERKKKDEFGRDVSLREIHPSRSRTKSRSRSKGRGRRRSESKSKKRLASGRNKAEKVRKSFSRSRSKSHNVTRSRRRRSYSSSSSSSSSTTSTSSSSSYSSSSSSSRSRSRSRRTKERKRLSKSRSKSLTKKVEKKKTMVKPKEKIKKIVVTPQKKKNEDKKKEKKKGKEEEPKLDKPKKKRKRDKTPLQSKEVYQAGGSIMVSVNFSRNTAKENKDPKKKKDKDVKADDSKKKKKMDKNASSPFHAWSPRARSVSPVGKHTPLQDEPMWSPENLHHATRATEVAKSPEIIDLDIIMVTPPPQEPILISDSEEEEEGITRLPPDLGAQQRSPVSRNQGPKTPPEPGVKFTLSTKQVLKPITNPLRDEEEEERSVPVPSRGPNTPPGPPPESDESIGRPKSPIRRIPRSPVGTPPASSPEPDVYDPFEPTKSPSPPTRSPQQEARVSSSDQTDQNIVKSPTSHAPSKGVPSPPPPPLPTDPPQKDERPPEPQKAPEDEASSTAAPQITAVTIPTSAPPPTIPPHSVAPPPNQIVTSLPGVISLSAALTVPPITTISNTQPLNQMQQIFAGLPANVANILYPAALAAAAMRSATNSLLRPPGNALVPPDFSRPPPATPGMLSRPPPISPLKIDRGKVTQNGQNLADVIDMDLGSPTSPDSSDVSDMFEPPSPRTTVSQDKTSPRKPRPAMNQKTSPLKPAKHFDKFDVLFGSSNEPKPSSKTSHKSKPNLKGKSTKKPFGKKLENEEDIPSSAVDLQVKEKLLKKVQRQERVVDEVKLCLKPFYNKKTINKEDYKDIMKKCVQKVCHNKSGEINPNKIRSLVEGYIKKVKYYRKKHGMSGAAGILSQIKGAPILPPTVNDPPPPGFGLKTHLKIK